MIESKLTKTGYELESVHIIQTPYSEINHRDECDPTIELCGRRMKPVIVSPMGAVTDENNYKVWLNNGFICVVPRTVDIEKRLEISKETFASFSLNEAEDVLTHIDDSDNTHYVCIDIAHGTMKRLYDICRKLKAQYGNKMIIMTGNVATPEAYDFYANAGIDYMRATIGTGSRCTTSCNVGVHYPTATLIDELRMKKEKWEEWHGEGKGTKIIVDGGISNFDDIQKCIALGAFAVMGGSIFARAVEACEPIVFLHPDNLTMSDAIPYDAYMAKLEILKEFDDESSRDAYNKLMKRKPYREYYGMSTKKAQKITGGSGKTTSEGIIRPIPVEYPIARWAENMNAYMVSCMSYTGFRTLEEMREGTELIINLSGDRSFRK